MAEQVNGNMTVTASISGQLSGVPAVSNYENMKNKPQINGVELTGNKTGSDLGLASAEEVNKLQKTIESLIDGNEVAY